MTWRAKFRKTVASSRLEDGHREPPTHSSPTLTLGKVTSQPSRDLADGLSDVDDRPASMLTNRHGPLWRRWSIACARWSRSV